MTRNSKLYTPQPKSAGRSWFRTNVERIGISLMLMLARGLDTVARRSIENAPTVERFTTESKSHRINVKGKNR